VIGGSDPPEPLVACGPCKFVAGAWALSAPEGDDLGPVMRA
jgi:hypothetical protein